ncbi:hypothetical protein GCM10022276_23590 [Sphingomonas limnosediminicola]|uniref:Lipoprotein n=1 Tax=Sphingomonas limnosediminicola TaxID=940133 RepID=A0ABP7LP81_9SPHN
MKSSVILVAAAAAGLTACGGTDSTNASANATVNAATAESAKAKHPTYCFYKDSATKAWTAARDKSGNLTVKGKVHLDDAAYRGDFAPGEVDGDKASVWLIMNPNTGYASPDGWWDVTATIPDSKAAKSVAVMCGKKTVATLTPKS